jgi:hypothetical protein
MAITQVEPIECNSSITGPFLKRMLHRMIHTCIQS